MKYELFKYLENDNNREKISKFIHDNMPELLECDPNNHINNTVCIKENTHTNELYFSLILTNPKKGSSYQNLYDIKIENSDLHDVEKISIQNCWGYKLKEGLKYPALGLKFKSLIIQYLRQQKLKKINKDK